MENRKKVIYFIGIGGISMSSLASVSKAAGYIVKGSDRKESELTRKLEDEGIEVFIGQKKENIVFLSGKFSPEEILVVYTSAISEDNPEMVGAKERGIERVTRAEFLGRLMLSYKHRIGVAGTHGKSTTTAMTDLIFESAGKEPTLLNGAVMKEFGGAYKIGGNDWFVFEACEYCDSFLSFYPTLAEITNIDFDHADYFKSQNQYNDSFVKFISKSEAAVVNVDSERCREIISKLTCRVIRCSLGKEEADYYARNIADENGFYSFDLCRGENTLCRIKLGVLGKHNVSNALVSASGALESGIEVEYIKDALESFRGIKRRMELVREKDGIAVFDDYAHHPEEIKASLSAARETGRRVICVFQPHSVSRTAELYDEFKTAFGKADKVIFADIYENLESDKVGKGVSSKALASEIPGAEYYESFEKIAERVKEIMKPGDMIITMGAGDIYKVEKLF